MTSCAGITSSNLAPVVQTSVGDIEGVLRTHSIPQAARTPEEQNITYKVNEYHGIPYAFARIGKGSLEVNAF